MYEEILLVLRFITYWHKCMQVRVSYNVFYVLLILSKLSQTSFAHCSFPSNQHGVLSVFLAVKPANVQQWAMDSANRELSSCLRAGGWSVLFTNARPLWSLLTNHYPVTFNNINIHITTRSNINNNNWNTAANVNKTITYIDQNILSHQRSFFSSPENCCSSCFAFVHSHVFFYMHS